MAKLTKKDAFAIILEGIKHDFKAFGEALDGLNKKVDTGFKETHQRLDRVETEISLIKIILRGHDDRFQNHETRISNLENT